MNPALETTWLLKSPVENSELVTITGSNFRVEIEPSTTSELTMYDDFDADLWNAGFMLCRIDKRLFQLTKGSDCMGEVRATAKARFWWDFPDGDVKRHLKKKIGLRAVIPVASLELSTANFSLRNSDEKIVARGQLLQSVAGDCNMHYLTLQQMRGYKKCFLQAKKLFKPVLEREVAGFGLKTMFIDHNLVTGETRTEQALHLSPDMPTELAVRTMAIEILGQATLHVDGIVSDIDTVFLHQFRVSVRKLRSLISLLKKSLPPPAVEVVEPRLSAIAGKTSRLRDLDVFLLDKNHYRTMLPNIHETGLDELYVLVDKQRQQEKKRVARYFSSNQYQQDISICKAELSESPVFAAPMSKKPVLAVAKSLLIKRYKEIQSMSTQLNAESVDEDVHDIRKEFKKFRYLIEYFIELLPRKRTVRLLNRLKKLQVTLGQFNDYCVQIEFLDSFNDDRQIEMTKALSGLIAILHLRQIEARNQVETALAQFFTDQMVIEVELAFGSKAVGESK